MNRRKSAFPVVFVLVMILCVLFITWYLPVVSDLRFKLADAKVSLETSQGRERKQQHEYDETVEALADAREELERVQPLADQAADEKTAMKEERKQLRQEKKELEEKLASDSEGNDK
ncbi:MAG: hypothetical protein IKZ98_09205 [Clostridia bacterium]|nr:hypothetical protein [Clostridia bacterium]